MAIDARGRSKALALILGASLLAGQPLAAQVKPTIAQPKPAKPLLRKGEPVLVLPSAQPLQFFTIADRVASLRAQGVLGSGPLTLRPSFAATTAISQSDEPTIPASPLNLRSSLSDITPEVILGATGFAVPGGELASKWEGVMKRWQSDHSRIVACAQGDCSHAGARKWHDIHAKAAQRSGAEQLAFVNSAINRSIAYVTDFQRFGEADYWATPLEVLERAGDCEDYVIAKYLMLRALGLDAADMKLVALLEKVSGQYHAILAVRQHGEWVFLDNKRTTVTSASDYRNARPVATVDDTSGQSMLIAIARDALL